MLRRRILAAATALLAAPLLAQVPTAAGPGSADDPDLLTLARLADAMYDTAPAWVDERTRLPELPLLVEHVIAYIEEEGYGSGRIPAVVSMDVDFGKAGSLVAGHYDGATDAVELNERFLSHPAWVDRPWLAVLVHELIHAEGYLNEAQTQLITTEVLAAMANDGYPGAMTELADRFRRHALLSAWWLDAFEHGSLPSELSNRDPSPVCQMGCAQVTGDVGGVKAARRAIFDADELRRELARERFWLHRSQRDYDVVLGSYISEPLGVVLANACDGPSALVLERVDGWPPLFPSLDDTGAFLKEIGWC